MVKANGKNAKSTRTHTGKNKHTKEKQYRYYNWGKRDTQSAIDDLFLHENKQLSNAAKGINAKLLKTYKIVGPCEMVEKVGSNIYKPKCKGRISNSTWHANDLKLFINDRSEEKYASDSEQSTFQEEEDDNKSVKNEKRTHSAPPAVSPEELHHSPDVPEKRKRSRPPKCKAA